MLRTRFYQAFRGCVLLSVVFVAVLAKAAEPARKPVAAVVTEYRHNAHADVIASRLFQTQTLDDAGKFPGMELKSVFTDQVPPNDTSRKWARQYGFRLSETVADALTLGTDKLAVDGVLLIAEHGRYPAAPNGNVQYPKRRLFEQVTRVFRDKGQVTPLFIDKHLADNWKDASFIYETARKMQIPLMAGSSLPVLWRYPPVDVRRDAKLREFVAVSYGSLDAYGFHGLEMVQCLAERRAGGETGVAAVRCLTGDAVWKAGQEGLFSEELLTAALSRLKSSPELTIATARERAKDPVLFLVEYVDGLRASVLTLNGAVSGWAVAWQGQDESRESTLFWTQEARPFMHFSYLVEGIDRMVATGRPTWPVERTLLTSGVLDALLTSKLEKGRRIETPYLNVTYRSDWNWQQPPEPPPGRPIEGQ